VTARENGRITSGEEATTSVGEGTAMDSDDSVATSAIGRNERTAAADTRPDSVESSATDDRDIAVSVTGLSKRFGEGDAAVTAVNDVSVDVESGSIVGLLGPNGAGKTTLIKSILGMVVPDAGTVRIRGVDLYERPREAYGSVDAMLEGARNDYWRLTVRENLRYFATISGVDPNSVRDRHDRLLAKLGLGEGGRSRPRTVPGMKQKVSLASVLAGGASVVFLDEPALGLDVESSRTLQRELRRLAEEEALTVVLSSHHDMDVVETVCDRVLIMSEGEIIADDTVEALLSGTDRHRIRITSRDLDTAVVSALRRRFDAHRVESGDPSPRIEVATDSDGLYELMFLLRRNDVTLERVRTVEPDLEDVFVDLTTTDRGDR